MVPWLRSTSFGQLCLFLALAVCVLDIPETQAQEPMQLPPTPVTGSMENSSITATERLLGDRPIGQLHASIGLPPMTQPPANAAQGSLTEAGVSPQLMGMGRGWYLDSLEWDAVALRHLPLYFEEPNLERLGYYYGSAPDGSLRHKLCDPITTYLVSHHGDSSVTDWWVHKQYVMDCNPPQNQVLQPFVSAAHFYGRVAALPYMMGVNAPNEELYVLGEDRPGSPVPYRKYYIPLSLKGAIYQSAAVTGLAFLLP